MLINETLQLATIDFPTQSGGNIGTATTTVDSCSHIRITQTTGTIASPITIGLNAPTNPVVGQLMYLSSTAASTGYFAIAGVTVNPGSFITLIYGTTWHLESAVSTGSPFVASGTANPITNPNGNASRTGRIRIGDTATPTGIIDVVEPTGEFMRFGRGTSLGGTSTDAIMQFSSLGGAWRRLGTNGGNLGIFTNNSELSGSAPAIFVGSNNLTAFGGNGSQAVNTVDNFGSEGVGFSDISTATYTVVPADSTIWLNAATLQTVTIQAASSFPRRRITFVNPTSIDKALSLSYTRLDGITVTNIPAFSSVTIQSNGTIWKQIQGSADTKSLAKVFDLTNPAALNPIPFGEFEFKYSQNTPGGYLLIRASSPTVIVSFQFVGQRKTNVLPVAADFIGSGGSILTAQLNSGAFFPLNFGAASLTYGTSLSYTIWTQTNTYQVDMTIFNNGQFQIKMQKWI
jgi:hypothetical protein